MKYISGRAHKTKRLSMLASGVLALLAVLGMSFSMSGISSAREITSGGGGGGGGGSAICNPITSFTVKGDGRASETGRGSVDLNYTVKPCDTSRAVYVKAEIVNYSTGEVMWSADPAPFTYKISLLVPNRTLYTARVTVYDAVTGTVYSTAAQTVGTTPRGV